jgi:hypothetical protein
MIKAWQVICNIKNVIDFAQGPSSLDESLNEEDGHARDLLPFNDNASALAMTRWVKRDGFGFVRRCQYYE